MYYVVYFEDDHVEITHTLEHSRIHVPGEDVGQFIDMLLDAQAVINEGQQRKIDKERLSAWIENRLQVFTSRLVGMGLVIPIQKQATIANNDDR